MDKVRMLVTKQLTDNGYRLLDTYKNIIAKPNAKEEHGISVEMEFEIFCRVFGNKEVSVIQDMYSPSRNLSFNQKQVSTMLDMRNTRTSVNIREKVKRKSKMKHVAKHVYRYNDE